MLTDKKIGFIGGGAMAEAMIKGLLQAELVPSENVFVCEHKAERCEFLNKTYCLFASTNLMEVISKVDILFLAIKPQVAKLAIESVYKSISNKVKVVSIIAGVTIASLEEYFTQQAVIRVMPNTPMAVGQGMSAISLGSKATAEDGQLLQQIFNSAGKSVIVKESMMDAVTGLSGSGPAYVFVIIDALADAGVNVGLSRKSAIMLAAQTLLGAASMVLETGKHPAELRDMVTSPAGTTIAGVHVLEQRGVRGALMDAVEVSTNKSKSMGKNS